MVRVRTSVDRNSDDDVCDINREMIEKSNVIVMTHVVQVAR